MSVPIFRFRTFPVEYGGSESTGPSGLASSAYLRILADMDFCISPPGWERYTHRTVEAIVRGSVPILTEPRVYELGLEDGENCIVVREWELARSHTPGIEYATV